MPALRELAVSCKGVDDESLAKLPDFPFLREFMPMDVTDGGFRHVGGCDNLESRWCMYCRDTGDKATEHLTHLQKLKTYYEGKTNITDRTPELVSEMHSLEQVEFWQCAGLTDECISQLTDLPNLREVSLMGLPGVTRPATALFPPQVRVRYAA